MGLYYKGRLLVLASNVLTFFAFSYTKIVIITVVLWECNFFKFKFLGALSISQLQMPAALALLEYHCHAYGMSCVGLKDKGRRKGEEKEGKVRNI